MNKPNRPQQPLVSAHRAADPRRMGTPKAPSPYRPQALPKCLQPKAGPTAPPVYRPQPEPKVLQRKDVAPRAKAVPPAMPVPKVLQRKSSAPNRPPVSAPPSPFRQEHACVSAQSKHTPAHRPPSTASRHAPAERPTCRPGPKEVVQRKVQAGTGSVPMHARHSVPKVSHVIQPYGEATAAFDNLGTQAAVMARKASGTPKSLRNWASVTYTVAGGAPATVTAVSQEIEEVSNPSTHAERRAIAKVCSAVDVKYTPESPKLIGAAFAQANVAIVSVFTELQPCTSCEEWLRGIDNYVPINVLYADMLEGSRDMDQETRTSAFAKYVNDITS